MKPAENVEKQWHIYIYCIANCEVMANQQARIKIRPTAVQLPSVSEVSG
jgi:hypothetical protein